ncbi:xanthine dehydrogenase family protein molybdopterin-binding subunit [Mesorhizobium argentiipisi]|uniref:Xanthine dehydrogenase family protein molybdopterin-binding subunit n=1 Tax=Mesorhizobium argentiipisi TaxID=3015175 RepID=A0ABU8KNS3_9HYPH
MDNQARKPDLHSPVAEGPSVGRPVRRLEDERLLRGGSRYVSDLIATSDALRVKILRSPHAHARILAVDATAARAMPGVVAVLMADDLAGIGDLPCDWEAPGMIGVPLHPVLARDRARYVGEPIAAVAAESANAAENALAAIEVSYEVLPAVAEQEAAIEPGAAQLHDALPNNIGYQFRREGGHVDRALADAEVVVRRRLTNNRVAPAPLEGRVVLSEFALASGRLVHHTSSQLPHVHARSLGACLGLPLHKLRLVAPDIGGGFGAKLCFYAEDVICAVLSMRTGRACAWAEARGESFLATTHGRDQVQYAEIAARRDGRITGFRSRVVADLGAYAIGMGPGVPAINTGYGVSGPYDIPNVATEVVGVFTNRTPTGPYRGAGHPEATFLLERMMDELARELAMDPAEVRRVNFVPPSAMPHRMPTGWTLDSGDYAANLDAALDLAGYRKLRERQANLRAEGRFLGIGLATFSESSAVGPSIGMGAVGFWRAGHESARVVVNADGSATVFSGAMSTGQGHATSLAQIAADVLGLAPNEVEVVQGDTQAVPFGTGTFNSRSMAIGGTAVHMAAGRLLEKARKIAAHQLQRRPADLTFEHGVFRASDGLGVIAAAAHTGKKVEDRIVHAVFRRRLGMELPPSDREAETLTLADVARDAHLGLDLPMGTAPGLDETEFFDPVDMPFAYGTHIAVVEVDLETGQVALLRHVVVDDCGRIINPLLVEGQVHGGAAQGVGQALMESMVYGMGGEPMVAGFSEYAMPRAADLPSFETGHTEVPTKLNPLGAKGVGEGATIGATPAVVNAVLDALAPVGVTEVAMPMTPMHVWRAIERAQEGRGSLVRETGAEPSSPGGSQAGAFILLGQAAKGGDDA